MIINTLAAYRWKKELTESAFDGIGKNSIARLKSSLKKVGDAISVEIKPLDTDFLDWFTPTYQEYIGAKNNPKLFDVKGTTLEKNDTYQSLSLHEGKKCVGATIFRFNEKNVCSIAYRFYDNNWSQAKLQAKPSLLSEYYLCEHAFNNGIYVVSHGIDRHPYGVNSSIGLAAFKLSAGCYPYKGLGCDVQQINTENLSVDSLIFEAPKDADNPRATKGYLLTSRETEHKWPQVTKYPHIIEIETIYRD